MRLPYLPGGVIAQARRPLYDRALSSLGQDGPNAVIFTAAQSSSVALMLNAYDVPDETVDTDASGQA